MKNFDKNMAKYNQFACNGHQRRHSKSSLIWKNEIWQKKIFSWKKPGKVSKNAEFHADFKSVEKVGKNEHEKNYLQKKFDEHE